MTTYVNVATLRFEERIGRVFEKTLPKLGPDARAQLQAMMSKESLAIIAGVLMAWVVSHAFGLGEIIDVLLATLGLACLGWAVFIGLDHLWEFADGTYRARSEGDLERASDHLAKAITTLGIQAVLAVIFRGAKAPRTGKGGRPAVGAGPTTGGSRYKPSIRQDPNKPAGHGETSWWGDITVSSRGSATDKALVLLHEKVHQMLTPKLYLLRNFRVANRKGSYLNSSLWRYIEEALAETIAQVGVQGFTKFFGGVRFPVANGYVYLARGGGFAQGFYGQGVVPEAAGLLYQGVVAGIAFEVRHLDGAPSSAYPQSGAH